ncbi:MAG TPA: hypothetical protein VF796_03365, partial [Humisphaera sp.]
MEIDGAIAGTAADGLTVVAAGVVVRGLSVYGFEGGSGVVLAVGAAGARVENCHLGTDAAGTRELPNDVGVRIESAGASVVGSVVSGNRDYGLLVRGANAVVSGNLIGTDAAGTAALGNNTAGILVDGATGTVVGGGAAADRNVISGNDNDGVEVVGGSAAAAATVIAGNWIGPDATGTRVLGNAGDGVRIGRVGRDPTDFSTVYVPGRNVTVGGTAAAAAGNVIAGSQGDGVGIDAGVGVTVVGNVVGLAPGGAAATDAAGTSWGNVGNGVQVQGTSDQIVVGGTTVAARNVIANNAQDGVRLFTAAATAAVAVRGNYIGTAADGTSARGNEGNGVSVYTGGTTADGMTVGGTAAGAGNVIAANAGHGVDLEDAAVVRGNLVGTAADGVTPLGNDEHGIYVDAPGCVVGSPTGPVDPAAANRVAFNGWSGVVVAWGDGSAVRGNAVWSNGQLGIDLGDDGVTANDAGDADDGPNGLQNYPVLTSATRSGGTVAVAGTFDSAPGATYVLDVYG